MEKETFHKELKRKMDEFVHFVYNITRKFPKEELYRITSQLRRASPSVILNYIEGYARGKDRVYKNFLEISYGSLKESKYLIYFAYTENFITEKDYQKAIILTEKIGAMLWGTIRRLS